MSRWAVFLSIGTILGGFCNAGEVQAVTSLWAPETPLTVTVTRSNLGGRLTFPGSVPEIPDPSVIVSGDDPAIDPWSFGPGEDPARRERLDVVVTTAGRLGHITHKPRDPAPEVTVVPEPASLALFAAGLLFVSFSLFSRTGKGL